MKLGATREVRFRTKDSVQVNGLLTLRLKLTSGGESVTLVQQIHVSTSP